jgi:hypothetical protein
MAGALGAAGKVGAEGLGGALFSRQIGPLPLWGWAVIAVAGGGVAYYLYKKRSGPTGGASGLGGNPAAVDQNIDPNTGTPWSIESAINPATGLPAYYGGPGIDTGSQAGGGGSGGPVGEPGGPPGPNAGGGFSGGGILFNPDVGKWTKPGGEGLYNQVPYVGPEQSIKQPPQPAMWPQQSASYRIPRRT